MSQGQWTQRITSQFIGSVAPPEGERLLLYDFTTGRPDLLPRHREALSAIVVPRLGPRAGRCAVWIGGLASRRGGEALNRGLAFARAGNVEQFLRSAVPGIGDLTSRHGLSTQYFGERLSTHHTENSEYYRSVLVVMRTLPPYVPSPRPPEVPRQQVTNQFNVRMVWGFEGGEGLTFASYTFVIDYASTDANGPASDPVAYKLRAAGLGGGPTPVGGSVADPTSWSPFTAMHVSTTRGFEGIARVTGWNVAWGWDFGRTHLRLIPDASEEDILILNIESQCSYGVGGSMVQGPFTIDEETTRMQARSRGPR